MLRTFLYTFFVVLSSNSFVIVFSTIGCTKGYNTWILNENTYLFRLKCSKCKRKFFHKNKLSKNQAEKEMLINNKYLIFAYGSIRLGRI